MPFKCPKCGAINKDGVKFCMNCGASIPTGQPQTPPPQPTPQYTQPSAYAPTAPKKSPIKIIIGIIVLVVVLAVVLAVVFMLLGGGSAQDFIGSWDVTSTIGSDVGDWTFNEDGTIDATSSYGYTSSGTWKYEGGKLHVVIDDYDQTGGQGYSCSFQGNTIELKMSGGGIEVTIYTLTKK
jgi:hypothetical protein